MKIAVPSMLPTLDACVGAWLHRSKYLLIIDFETMKYAAMMNPIMLLGGPAAWEMVAQQLLQEDVRIVLASNCKSMISKSLGGVGIQVIAGMSGSASRAVKQFKKMCNAETLVIAREALQN